MVDVEVRDPFVDPDLRDVRGERARVEAQRQSMVEGRRVHGALILLRRADSLR